MNGDPIDPISFELAVKELWDRLASRAGLNLMEHLLSADNGPSPGLEAERRERDDLLGHLREEAHIRLLGLIIVEELRAWTADGDHWKRPTPHALRERRMKADDEPWSLFVDRAELIAITAARWPELACFETSAGSAQQDRRGGKRGRPPGSGSYEADDAPLLLEMVELIKTRTAKSPNAAAQMVAERAPGASFESKVKRLRDAYVRKLRNGE